MSKINQQRHDVNDLCIQQVEHLKEEQTSPWNLKILTNYSNAKILAVQIKTNTGMQQMYLL